MLSDHAASSSSPAQVKPGPKAVIITLSGRPCFEQPFEHEQHGRRAHVAIVAQHFALEVELALVELERSFDRIDHLHAARMAAEAVDVVARDAQLVAHPSTASASSASMNGGIARSNTTARPGSSTSQPMIRSVSGHSFSADPVMRARLCSPLVTTAAAAPSPNRAVATTAAGSSLSRRIEIEQVSTVTNSQLLPGSAAPAGGQRAGR